MTGPGRLDIAVLISGTGSNLKALIEAMRSGRLDIDIVHVISNRADAKGLEHARAAGIPVSVFGGKGAELDATIGDCLESAAPDLVVLAGFMRILGPELVRRFSGRIINLHPSLLPLYPGLDTYRRALEAGDREHGSSMHFVTAGLDDGPLIAQAHIPILAGDDPSTLAGRLGPVEHRLIVSTVELFTRHRVEMGPGCVKLDGTTMERPLRLTDDDRLN